MQRKVLASSYQHLIAEAPVNVAPVTPYFRLVVSSSAPRNSSNTKLTLRRDDHRPLTPRAESEITVE